VDLTRLVTFELIYRPPITKILFVEFSELLSSMTTCCDSLVIIGDVFYFFFIHTVSAA